MNKEYHDVSDTCKGTYIFPFQLFFSPFPAFQGTLTLTLTNSIINQKTYCHGNFNCYWNHYYFCCSRIIR
jgi:hypothetical protein